MIIELAITSAIAAGPISDLKQLKAYAGHNVWDRVKGAQSFLDTRVIKAQIGSLLSANEIARLRELEVGDDVDVDEGYAFSPCMIWRKPRYRTTGRGSARPQARSTHSRPEAARSSRGAVVTAAGALGQWIFAVPSDSLVVGFLYLHVLPATLP